MLRQTTTINGICAMFIKRENVYLEVLDRKIAIFYILRRNQKTELSLNISLNNVESCSVLFSVV